MKYRYRPNLTRHREAFLRELLSLGIGEPTTKGPVRHACLKLGWAEGAYRLPTGEIITHSEFYARFPPSPDRWTGVDFIGVTITEAGRAALREAE